MFITPESPAGADALCSVSKCFCNASADGRFFIHVGHKNP